MKQLRLITIRFNIPIKGYEIPAFRGALVRKVGREHEWFHNHNNETNGFHYRYPRIQYKRHRGKPMLVCLENGIEEIQKYFSQSDWSLEFSGENHKMGIEELRVHQFDIRVMDKMHTYQIKNWIALNDRNHKAYMEGSPVEQIEILEKSLAGHIISFTKGIDYKPEARFDVKLDGFPETHPVKIKNITTMGFNVAFKTNLFLPNFIGLGKGVSKGYGVVFEKRNTKIQLRGEKKYQLIEQN